MSANFLSGNHLIRPPSGQRFMFHLEAGKYIRPLFLFSAWDVHSSAVTLNFIRLFISLFLSFYFFSPFKCDLSSLFLFHWQCSVFFFFSSLLSLLLYFSLSLSPLPFSFLFSINNFSIFLLSLISLSTCSVSSPLPSLL